MICWEKNLKKGHKDKLQRWFVKGLFRLFCFLIMRKIILDKRKDWSLLTLKKKKNFFFVHYFSACRHLKLMGLQKT